MAEIGLGSFRLGLMVKEIECLFNGLNDSLGAKGLRECLILF